MQAGLTVQKGCGYTLIGPSQALLGYEAIHGN